MRIDERFRHAPDLMTNLLADELFRGARLIGQIENAAYTCKKNGAGSIGAHFRHNLDFANSFLKGIKPGKIDYTARERDLRIEENRLYAIKKFALTVSCLRSLPPVFGAQKVLVRSEVVPDLWHESSVARELEFLHSHTVHHHALIAEKLAFLGFEVAGDFGVAPSTLKFWERQKKAAEGN